jgi:hypothetical protein
MIVVVVVVAVVIVTVGIVLGSTGSSSRPGYHGPADRRAHRKRHGELGESGKRVHIGAAWMQTVTKFVAALAANWPVTLVRHLSPYDCNLKCILENDWV